MDTLAVIGVLAIITVGGAVAYLLKFIKYGIKQRRPNALQ